MFGAVVNAGRSFSLTQRVFDILSALVKVGQPDYSVVSEVEARSEGEVVS